MLRKFGNYLLSSDTRASSIALILATLPFFGIPTGFLALVILGLVTLVKGPRSGLVVLAWVILPPLCQLYLHQWAFIDAITLMRCVLVLVLAAVFRARTSWRLVLEVEVLVGLLMVLGFHIFIGDLRAWWTTLLNTYFDKIELNQQLGLAQAQFQQFVEQVIPYATGFVVMGALIGVFVLVILARWWQKSLSFSDIAFAPEFAAIRISLADTGVIGVAMLAWLLTKNALLLDCMPVLLFPTMIVGLSILHYAANRKKSKTLIGGNGLNMAMKVVLFVTYMGLILVPWIFASALALLGMVDSGFNVRKTVFDRKRVKA